MIRSEPVAAASRRAMEVRGKRAAAPFALSVPPESLERVSAPRTGWQPVPRGMGILPMGQNLETVGSALALRFGGFELTHGFVAQLQWNERCEPAGPVDSALPVAGKSGWWIASGSGPRRSPRTRCALVRVAEPWPSHRRSRQACWVPSTSTGQIQNRRPD
jgi:hypothetical protein